jgi:hypothetical protein
MEEDGGTLGLAVILHRSKLHPAPALVCVKEDPRRAASPLLGDQVPTMAPLPGGG